MSGVARRAGWSLSVVLVLLVALAAVLLVRMLGGTGEPASAGTVDGTTPAVATARVESEALKAAALRAAKELVVDEGTAVVGTGIISVTADDARVLLFVDEAAGTAGRVALKRLVATLHDDDDGGGWRLTAIDPV